MGRGDFKVSLLTGAAGGIGQKIAMMLDEHGYHQVLVDLNQDKLQQLSSSLTNESLCIVADITDWKRIDEIEKQVIETYGKLDLLINNAGVINTPPMEELTYEKIDLEIDVNYKGSVYLTKAFVPHMMAEKSGHIISISSLGGLMPLKETPGYSGTKFALRGYMLSLYQALKPYGIYVTTIYPTAIDTPMLLHEIMSGGSLLNFSSAPLKPKNVADAVHKAIEKRSMEIAVPKSAGVFCKIITVLPKSISFFEKIIRPIAKFHLKKYLKENQSAIDSLKNNGRYI